ncbi:glycosyl transferase [Pedobacter petrophilus]|uniref:Glycosyl transferase n=1 Tax=Pedobacter petrophilus TaxID=1908241 RepID=A0A7K0FX36_9SPHI|nr:glycosyl transferase [Pedobacter petrophilus]MRX75624.1 glycosyl transferase [Pedobacter petrophilus]
MMKASKVLPPIISDGEGHKIYFLTGKNYLYQTLFCAYSLIKISKTPFQFILIDDGTFDQKLSTQANKQMPGVKIITTKEIENNLELKLPIANFPYLHYKRKVYPHIKKLTDIHTIGNEPHKLVLDSDMLFWNDPAEMINWLKSPIGSLHMADCEESYGYSIKLMESLCQTKIPELINVGAIGLNSATINWIDVEHWAKTLEEKEGASYFLEQALSAMIIANQLRTILAPQDYIVNPKNGKERKKVLGHYVDLSKKEYFQTAWL